MLAFMFSIPCFAGWQLTEEQQKGAREYYSVNNDIFFMTVYSVKTVCPDGFAKFDTNFTTCYGCETEEEFSSNVYTNHYYKKVYKDYSEAMMDMSMGSFDEQNSIILPPPLPTNF